MSVLSRNAETEYWTGRYVERAECTARILMEHIKLQVDLPRGLEIGWEPLLVLTGAEVSFHAHFEESNERQVLEFLVGTAGTNPGSILSSLARARENMRTTRPVSPPDAWWAMNELFLFVTEQADDAVDRRTCVQFFGRLIEGCQRLWGTLDGTMNHDEVYAFFCMGRDLERADMTTRVIDVRAETMVPRGRLRPFDNVQWMSVLRSLSAYQMYRRVMGAEVQGPRALRFLLQDRSFPRSVSFCLDRIDREVKSLPRPDDPLDACTRARLLLHEPALSALAPSELRAFVDGLQLALDEVHAALSRTYFEHGAERSESAGARAGDPVLS